MFGVAPLSLYIVPCGLALKAIIEITVLKASSGVLLLPEQLSVGFRSEVF